MDEFNAIVAQFLLKNRRNNFPRSLIISASPRPAHVSSEKRRGRQNFSGGPWLMSVYFSSFARKARMFSCGMNSALPPARLLI
ncbi:MAG TPA: hypothetical protein PLR50_13715, partial [Candidatus Rifleibacterium sp.]|nr:hypothetical protein [Candidatus Rifleibacterium sp.]